MSSVLPKKLSISCTENAVAVVEAVGGRDAGWDGDWDGDWDWVSLRSAAELAATAAPSFDVRPYVTPTPY